jgi:hypothetical protein
MLVDLHAATLLRSRRARLLAGCAVATALATPAIAQQGFQATPEVVVGGIEITQGQSVSGGLRDTVSVFSRQSVINWTPNDTGTGGGPIAILPQGNELVFTGDPSSLGGSYTVLNRVIPNDPSRPIQFDGDVMSQFDSGYGVTRGGSIWFYSPGGIIAGPTSSFDVGNLVLSANDIRFANGLFGNDDFSAQAGTIQFRGLTDSRSGITIMPGARINAAGNYVALVAPRISQGGLTNVEGGAALVAAESVDITIPVSGGLFDIAVQAGSNVNPGGETTLTHTGTTETRDVNQTGEQRRVYLMAVPKNDAVTMLVSGSLGYAPAVQAQLSANGTIVLTTGNRASSDPVQLGNQGEIRIAGGDFGAEVVASAKSIAVETSAGDLSLASGLNALGSGGAINMTASAGRTIVANGDVLLRQNADDSSGASPISVTADGGSTIQVHSLTLDGRSNGANEAGYGAAVAATGHGLTLAASNGGIITAADFIDLDSSGFGGNGSSLPGANGTGGTIAIAAGSGGQIRSGGNLYVSAQGRGGDSGYGGAAIAGDGRGGSIGITSSGGGLISAGPLTVSTDGRGGFASFSGNGAGGGVTVDVDGAELDTSYLSVSASGDGRYGDAGAGSGQGGIVAITNKASGSIFAGNGIDLFASGQAGSAFDGAPVKDGTGGTITIVNDAASFSTGEGSLFAIAEGVGGSSNVFSPATGRGGTISVTINSADPNNVESGFFANGIFLSADGSLSRPLALRESVPHGSSGTGVGGSVLLNLTGGTAQTGDISLSASGFGANGDYDKQAGAGFAGRAELALNGSTLDAGMIDIVAEAFGGDGAFGEAGYGGAGAGGTAGIGTNPFGLGSGAYLTGSGGSISAESLTLSADATGGFGGDGQSFGTLPLDAAAGGAATGGTARAATSNVDLSVGFLTVTANATGGEGGTVDYSNAFFSGSETANAASGGAATGGTAEIAITGGAHSLDSVDARATGNGGFGGLAIGASEGSFDPAATSRGGDGGSGNGGTASIIFANATLGDQPQLTAEAAGNGQSGGAGAAGGNGGAGTGGAGMVNFDRGTANLFTINVDSYASGGFGGFAARLDGGNGGGATGGTARFEAANGAIINVADNSQFRPFVLDASAVSGGGAEGGSFAGSGLGGRGGSAASALGGTASVLVSSGAVATIPGLGGIENSPPVLIASARGGFGGFGGTGSATGNGGGIGGDGGSASAGLATIEVAAGQAVFGDVVVDASAQRGFGGSGGQGAPDPITGIVTTAASGVDGTGAGGRFTLAVVDGLGGQAGALNAGNLSADLTGSDFDGSLRIGDTGINGQGGIHLGSLYAVSFTNAPNTSENSSDYDIQSSARAIQVDGDVNLTANGQVRFAFQGTGGLISATLLDIRSNTRGISVTNSDPAATLATSLNAPTISLQTFDGDIDAPSGTLLASGGTITANAFRANVQIANAQAAERIDVAAFGNATVGSLSAGEITVRAGDNDGISNPADATITGNVRSTGGVLVHAGNDVTVAAGAQIVSDRFVTLASGDDIVIGPGALIRAANNPPPESGYGVTDPLEQVSQLRLMAGSIDIGLVAIGNVASILIDGTLEAPERTLFMSGGAVQAGASTQLTAGNLYVRLNNIPVGDQVPSNDGGQLAGLCVEGSVCLGTANVNGIVRVGETEFEPINLRLNGGIDGTDVMLRARSVELGQAGVSNIIRASDSLTLESLNANLTLDGPLTITGGSSVARVAAFRSIAGGAAQIDAPGTLDLYAGNDIALGAVSAATIRTVDFDGAVLNAGGLTVPGTIAIGRIASATTLELNAGKDIALDRFDVTGAATLTATNGTIASATDASAIGGITATAKSVTLNGLTGLNITSATATAGDLSLATKAGALTAGSSSASGNAMLDGAGPISFASLTAGNALTITGGADVTGGTASAGRIAIDTTGAFEASALTAKAGDLSASAGNGITLPTFKATGAATLTAANGAITVDTDAEAAGGTSATARSVLLVGQNGLGVTLASATAGDLLLSAASGDLTIDTARSSGTISLSAQNGAVLVGNDAAAGGGIVAKGLSVGLTGQTGLNVASASATAGDLFLTTVSGPISLGAADASGGIALQSAGAVSFTNLKAGGATGIAAGSFISGSAIIALGLDLATPGAIQLANGSNAGPITATGGSIDIRGTAGLRIVTATAGSGDLSLVAQQGITAGQVSAARTATLKSGSGPLVVTDDLVAGGGLVLQAPTIDITAQNGLNVLQADATAGDLKLTTVSGTLSAGNSAASGAITLASGGDVTAALLKSGTGAISVAGDQGVAIGTLASGGAVALASGNGAIRVSSDLTAAGPIQTTGRAVDLTAQGDLALAKAVATGGDLSVRSVNGTLIFGDASATGALTATTPGLLGINGAVTGGTIALTSNEIAIGSSAQLGSKTQTTSLTLTSTADRTFIGDAPSGTGYRLDNGELARIASKGDITLASLPGGAAAAAFSFADPGTANLVLGSISFDGSQFGGEGTLLISSARAIGIVGNAQFKTIGSGQTVTLRSTSDIALAAESGLVTLKDGSDGLSGTLRLEAQQVHAMSTAARNEVAGLDLDTARQRLGTNDQLANDGGYFQAGQIIVRINRLLFIQNSGANGDDPDAKRGFTTNSFRVETTGTQPAQLILNGRAGSATGQGLINAVSISGGFDARSSFNGCTPGSLCGAPTPDLFTPVFSAPRDQIEDDRDSDEAEQALDAAQTRPDPLIQFVDAPTSRFDPLIDQPVTGAGNEDFWITPTKRKP